MTDETSRRKLIGGYFAEEWAVEKALHLLDDFERFHVPTTVHSDALCDAAYIAGARAGFNAAASDDPTALDKLIQSRAGYLSALKESRAAQAQEGA